MQACARVSTELKQVSALSGLSWLLFALLFFSPIHKVVVNREAVLRVGAMKAAKGWRFRVQAANPAALQTGPPVGACKEVVARRLNGPLQRIALQLVAAMGQATPIDAGVKRKVPSRTRVLHRAVQSDKGLLHAQIPSGARIETKCKT